MIEFVVWIWLETAYNGNAIKVGTFENCDIGSQVAKEQYPNHVAMHCILPMYQPPGQEI